MMNLPIEILGIFLGLILLGIITKQITLEAENMMLFGNPTSIFIGLYTQSWLYGILALVLNVAIYNYRIRKGN